MQRLCFLGLLLATLYHSRAQTIVHSERFDDYLAKTVIVKVDPQYRQLCSETAISHERFKAIEASLGISLLHKMFPHEQPPAASQSSPLRAPADLSLIYEFSYTADHPIEKVIRQLLKTGLLLYAEPHLVPRASYMPNDPLATPSGQYHLQTINAFNAWTLDRGDSSIVIGITDTGTDPTHNDLFNSIKRNLNDPIDLIDNDGDGYVDNYMGWDLGMNDNDPTYQANAHGVHVCGIAGATADNNIGGAGVGFNCKILPVKISDASGNLIAAYQGIKYAADHGCAIINCSWGGNSGGQYGQDIIDYATINKNCLVVAAAGNNANSSDFFPAAYDGVMAVANTNSSDVLSASSDYGYFVDVCAPGESINSTWPGNAYVTLSGTSMSSPCTAGAAAIVKKQFPSYNGLQVAERLRVTADNIYGSNPSYTDKLGSGRINLYRALTDPAGPSVVFDHKVLTDHNSDFFMSGDTLFIWGRFTNYLAPTTALSATLTSLSAYASAIHNTTSPGVISTLSYTNNSSDPFSFKLTGSIPSNQPVGFKLQMQDGSYQASCFFTVYLNTDYINITVNNISTTATSKGNIGYNIFPQAQGLGFNYNNTDMMYEGGLMIGCDTTRVSNCIRGNSVSAEDADFKSMGRIHRLIPATVSDFDTDASFNDSLAYTPMHIEVHQKTFAWINVPNQKFVIWEYTILNNSGTDTLKNLYAGIFADWDIDGGTYSQNRSAYDAASKMGYSFYTGTAGKYAGIRLLTSNAAPNFYALDNVSGGNGGVDITNGFSKKEKYTCLSTPRLNAGVGGTGNDIANAMSTGPIQLLPGQNIKVAFALLGGDSLADLKNSAVHALTAYNGLPTTISQIKHSEDILVYPNPAGNYIHIHQPDEGPVTIQLLNTEGRILKTTIVHQADTVMDLSDVAEGVYMVRLQSRECVATRQVVKLK